MSFRCSICSVISARTAAVGTPNGGGYHPSPPQQQSIMDREGVPPPLAAAVAVTFGAEGWYHPPLQHHAGGVVPPPADTQGHIPKFLQNLCEDPASGIQSTLGDLLSGAVPGRKIVWRIWGRSPPFQSTLEDLSQSLAFDGFRGDPRHHFAFQSLGIF